MHLLGGVVCLLAAPTFEFPCALIFNGLSTNWKSWAKENILKKISRCRIVVDTYKQAAAKFESNDEYLKREVDEIVFERLRSRPHLPVAT